MPETEKSKQTRLEYREAHRQQERDRANRWREIPGNKERAAENHRQHPEWSNRWKKSHKQEVLKYGQKWRREHPKQYLETAKIINRRREGRKQSLPHTFTKDDWIYALGWWHGACAYCGNPPSMFDRSNGLHQDHYIPVSHGGGYVPDNILPACQSCNFSKHNREPSEWLVWKFGKRNAAKIQHRIEQYFAFLTAAQSDHKKP